jgi:hypothetical protein
MVSGLDEEDNNNNTLGKALPDMIEDQIIKGFQEELTRDDQEEALREVEESLK